METKKNPLLLVLGISFAFFVIFMIIVGVFMKNLGGDSSSGSRKKLFAKSTNIGVIEIKGTIMDSKKWLEQIDDFENDEMIKGVVIRINSPGGAVGPSQEVHDAVRRLTKKKPVVVSMGSVAASGGYYIAVGAKKIFANPGTITASIGVIMNFADMSKLFQWAKVNPYVIKTGKYKDVGSPNREMSAEEKELLTNMIMNVLGQFRRAVAEGRKMTMEKVIEISDGRIVSGEQAKALGLVDELGGIDEAIESVSKEAGISGKPHVVYAGKHKGLLEKILMGEEGEEDESSSKIAGVSRFTTILRAVLGAADENMTSRSSGSNAPMFVLPGF